MKMYLLTGIIAFGVTLGGAHAELMTTAITYQGELVKSGGPANGEFDFEFTLFDASEGGSSVAPAFLAGDVTVRDGMFTVLVDFGFDPFLGDQVWLELKVREGASSGGYSQLLPRQMVTATPYAMFSESSSFAGESAQVLPGGVDTESIRDEAITGPKIAEGSVGVAQTDGSLASSFNSSCPSGFYVSSVRSDGFGGGSGCGMDRQGVRGVGISGTLVAQTQDGGPADRSSAFDFCFLTRVTLNDVDASGEYAGCEIVGSKNNWTLQARDEDDADAICHMRCLNLSF